MVETCICDHLDENHFYAGKKCAGKKCIKCLCVECKFRAAWRGKELRQATDYEIFEQSPEQIPEEALLSAVRALREVIADCGLINKATQDKLNTQSSRAQSLEKTLQEISAGVYNPRRVAQVALDTLEATNEES